MFCGDDAGASLQEGGHCLARLGGQQQSLGVKCTCGKGQMIGVLMQAAGYKYTDQLPEQKKEFLQSDGGAVPAEVLTAAFPSYLTAATLEGNGQLGSFS